MTTRQKKVTTPRELKQLVLKQLARRIQQERQAAARAQYDSIVHAREMGALLIEIEERLPDGKFMRWLERQPFGASADLHMALHREWNNAIRREWDKYHDGQWAKDQRSERMNLWGARHLADIVYKIV